MSYQVQLIISESQTPAAFRAFIKLIDHIRMQFDIHSQKEILAHLRQEFDIILHPYSPGDHGHRAEFACEKDYLVFLLRWA